MEQLKESSRPFYILSLDGGGSLGVYTLGILVELERLVGTKLLNIFDLVYGTSTGAIIASLVALGEPTQPTICERLLRNRTEHHEPLAPENAN